MFVSARTLRGAAAGVIACGAMLIGGAQLASAEPAPAPPPPNCTAGDLAVASGTVGSAMGDYLFSHPDVNDFFTSLVFLSGSKAVTLPVVVYSFVGELVSKWNVIFAAVILSMIPFLAFYLLAQKKFIQGFAGGIKS